MNMLTKLIIITIKTLGNKKFHHIVDIKDFGWKLISSNDYD